jgi:3-phosphoshikimate 1-carboxyvinyltransferase
MDRITITPRGPVRGRARVPGSKSLTNRAMLLAALAEGESLLEGALDSDDTRAMAGGLAALGAPVDFKSKTSAAVRGTGRPPAVDGVRIDIGNAGTAMRFLTAYAAAGRCEVRIDGDARMRQRPVGDLVDALRSLGVDIRAESPGGCPPVAVRSAGLPGGRVRVAGETSSQFASALLMAAPYALAPLEVELTGAAASRPFIEMTIRLMERFGVETARPGQDRFAPRHGARYAAGRYKIEPDATAASYFWAAAAVAGGSAEAAIPSDTMQGDAAFADALGRMGCQVTRTAESITVARPEKGRLRGIDIDMKAIPDTAQTLAVVALFAGGRTRITGVGNLRVKETDRLAALAAELPKLGAKAEAGPDWLTIDPPARVRAAEISTYGDHRMAMSFALAGLAGEGVTILDPGCVAKTFPDYFDALREMVV